ncbi:MAG: tetratricopeptide repeat protein [Elusimicrobia bacterium]|nr:tetratricopeptide repeat protein [Elusimicrobiota bacterium]
MKKLIVAALLLSRGVGQALAQAVNDPISRRYYYEDIFEPFFSPDKDNPEIYRSRRPGAANGSFPIRKGKDAFRIFILGSSIAKLFGESREGGFREMLGKASPFKEIELLNCGMSGYDSFRTLMLESEVLAYSPDLIVILMGFTEAAGTPPVPLWLLKVQDRLSRLKAYQALLDKFSAGPPSRPYAEMEAAFGANLRQMLRQARLKGVPAVVVVPPLNYRDAPPTGPAPADERFVKGWVLHLQGRHREAAAELRLSGSALGLFYAGRSEERRGLAEDARRDYERSIDLDRKPDDLRCGSSCRGLIKRVSREEGAILADADALFKRKAFPGLPGLDMFDDAVHWKSPCNALVSAAVIESMGKKPEMKSLEACPGARGSWTTLEYAFNQISAPNRRSLSHRAVVFLEASLGKRTEPEALPALVKRAAASAAANAGPWGAPAVNTDPSLFYWHLGEIESLRGNLQEAGRFYSRALALNPALPRLWASQAVALALLRDRDGARRSFTEGLARARGPGREEESRHIRAAMRALGLEQSPRTPPAAPRHLKKSSAPRLQPFWTAQAYSALRAKNRRLALEFLAKAMSSARAPGDLHAAALGYQEAGDLKTALRLLNGLARRAPPRAEYLKDLGICLYRSGNVAEAIKSLEAAVRLDPEGPQALMSLGSIYQSQGRLRQALKLYDSALAAGLGGKELNARIRDSRKEILSLPRKP